ncbi:hypothetical protein [Facklamia sp. P12955]|uniref:hypothetical protein n=1 Tax=Facklamia sp. P12955 TaxID=3421946 RepID=UPI003D187688
MNPKNKIFYDDHKKWLKDNVKGVGNKELTEMFNSHFNMNLSVNQIRNEKKRLKIRSGLAGHFVKGHVPANKGKKVGPNPKSEHTYFKK